MSRAAVEPVGDVVEVGSALAVVFLPTGLAVGVSALMALAVTDTWYLERRCRGVVGLRGSEGAPKCRYGAVVRDSTAPATVVGPFQGWSDEDCASETVHE